MSGNAISWHGLIDGLRRGDEAVAAAFFAEYGQVLLRIARKRLGGELQRRVDEEDIVQSVFRSFFRRVQEGSIVLSDGQKMWNLLCAITLTKVRRQSQYHSRQRRSIRRESAAGPPAPDCGPDEPIDPAVPPEVLAAFEDEFQSLLEDLDPLERRVVDLRLQDLTNDEIALEIGVSERTVRRTLKRIERRLESLVQVE